jgi:hypothetical protein
MSENWHKRHALSLASQLPENASDANAVIRELQHLVDSWLHPASFAQPSANVLALRRDTDCNNHSPVGSSPAGLSV